MQHLVRYHLHTTPALERSRIYWTMSIKTLGISLVGVFVPIYLYNLGYSLRLILVYFLVRELAELSLVFVTSIFMARFGVKRVLTAGCFLAMTSLYMLYLLPNHSALFIPVAIMEGAAISFFFLPYHFLFSAAMTKSHGGRQLSRMDNLICIVEALGPLIGGLVATILSLQVALVAALVIVTLSILPLLSTADGTAHYQFSMRAAATSAPTGDLLSNIGFGISEMAATIVWPLFIFLVVNTYISVGFIVTASLLFTLVLVATVGRLADKGRARQLMRAGSLTSAMVHFLRFLGSSFASVIFINFAADGAHALFRVPWNIKFYEHASESDRAAYIAAMEMAVCIGRAVFWAILLIFTFQFTQNRVMLMAFGLGAIGSLLVPLIVNQKSTKV